MTRTAACRICNGPANQWLTVREMMYGTRDTFDYFVCGDCGCLQIAEIPWNIARYYPSDYYSYDDVPKRPRWVRDTTRKLRNSQPLNPDNLLGKLLSAVKAPAPVYQSDGRAGLRLNGALLDVGGGAGAHIRELRMLGLRDALCVNAFIPDDVLQDGVLLAKKGTIFDIDLHFDLITFHHSLEHMNEQREVLEHARNLLTETGQILVRVPTVSSEAFDKYREHWSDLYAPRHFYLHSHRSIEILARNSGLRVTDLWCDSNAFQYWASEQYAADIPLNDPRSHTRDSGRSPFTPGEIKAFEARAQKRNAELRGDSICVMLSPT